MSDSDDQSGACDQLAALSLSADDSRVHERRLRAILIKYFSPAVGEERPPPHLKYIGQVLSPMLQTQLNAQLSAMGRDATLPTLQRLACGHCAGLSPDGLRIQRAVISGSLADRVGWLTINNVRLTLHSDHDYMLELNVSAAPLAAAAASASSEPCLALSATPGYYRLLLGWSDDCWHPERLELEAGAVRDVIEEAVRRHRPGQEPRASGPAVTFEGRHGDIDCVPCVPVRGDAAVPWLERLRARARPAGWPPRELLQRLDGPLHLVPVGPDMDDRRLWRLSFSQPEALLVRALPAPARYCLLLLRLARACRRPWLGDISSYYLKTCVFWLCEHRPEADWREPLAALRAVLDMLEAAIGAGFLPCYFWSEMNVFREPTPERLAALRRAARRFQKELVHILYDVISQHQHGVWGPARRAD